MISNIVHVTNLPRKAVVKWFENKRAEDGVPEQRLPYQHSANETAWRFYFLWVAFTYATSYVKNEKSYNHMKKNVSPIRNYGGDYMFGWNTDNNILQKESVEMSNTLGIIQCLYTFFSH